MHKMTIYSLFFAIATTISLPANAYLYYSASAFCRATNAVGYAKAMSRTEALNKAVKNCIGNGGIPSCCRSRPKISDTGHAAIAHCSRTGAKGIGFGYNVAQATRKAIARCVDNGGIRACCRSGVKY